MLPWYNCCPSPHPLLQPALYHLIMEGLPQDSSSQQNACIITHPHTSVWPLVVDPLGMVEQWLKGREREATMVEYKVCVCVCVCGHTFITPFPALPTISPHSSSFS